MTTDLENLTFDTLRTVNPGDIVEVSPATDDAHQERKHIRVSRVGDTGIIGEYVNIDTGEVTNADVLAALLAPHGLYSGYRKTIYLGEISHDGTLPEGAHKEAVAVYVTLAKEGDEPRKVTSAYSEELREFNADSSNPIPLSENAQLLIFRGDRVEFKVDGQEGATRTYRAYRNMRLFNEQDEHVGHLRHVMRRHDCETCNLLLDAVDDGPTSQRLVEEWEEHRTTCGGYNTRSVVEYVEYADGEYNVIGEVNDLKVNWDDLHQGTLGATSR
jgi:hypothetical protein